MGIMLYSNRILLAAAVIPAIVLMVKVYKTGRHEKEPPTLLLSLIFSGIIATVFAMITEKLGSAILVKKFAESTLEYNLIMYFGIVAVSEEGFKYLLLKKRTWRNEAFNYSFDGIVYSVFLSLGFALWENIGYVFMYGFSTAVVRAMTAVPGHACFGVFMGLCYGAAKRYENEGKYILSKVSSIFALLLPIALHGAYDFLATGGITGSSWAFYAYIAVLFVLSFIIIRTAAKRDKFIAVSILNN